MKSRLLLSVLCAMSLMLCGQSDTSESSQFVFATRIGSGGINLHNSSDSYKNILNAELLCGISMGKEHFKKLNKNKFFQINVVAGYLNYLLQRKYSDYSWRGQTGNLNGSSDPKTINLNVSRWSASIELNKFHYFKNKLFVGQGIGCSIVSFYRSADFYYNFHLTGSEINTTPGTPGFGTSIQVDETSIVKDYYRSTAFGIFYYNLNFGYSFHQFSFFMNIQAGFHSLEIDNHIIGFLKPGVSWTL